MKHNVILTVTSLLPILLLSIHLTDDIVRGFDKWGFEKLSLVLILVVWLYGTLVLAERRSGHVIMLLGGLLAALIPAVHMRGTGSFVKSSGQLAPEMALWVWLRQRHACHEHKESGRKNAGYASLTARGTLM